MSIFFRLCPEDSHTCIKKECCKGLHEFCALALQEKIDASRKPGAGAGVGVNPSYTGKAPCLCGKYQFCAQAPPGGCDFLERKGKFVISPSSPTPTPDYEDWC
jgi:hypothetical protein